MNHPYNDEYMTYDYRAHKYRLTPFAVREMLAVSLEDRLNARGMTDKAAAPVAFLRVISDEIYAYIYSCNDKNLVQEFLAAKHPAARNILMEAMLAQVTYTLLNGDVSNLSGIDIRKGMAMDKRALNEARIAPVAVDILSRDLDVVVPSLCYRGANFGGLWTTMTFPAYEQEGY